MNTNLAHNQQTEPFFEAELVDFPSEYFSNLLGNSYPLHPHEKARLACLKKTELLDSPPEAIFNDLVWLAAKICNCPMAAISLVAEDRQWFKARIGLRIGETAREHAFCNHCVATEKAMEVNDARKDDRFLDNPLVTEDPKIRFYAGAPIGVPDHPPLGTLCVMAKSPRELSRHQRRALRVLAKQASKLLELAMAKLRLAD